MKTFLFALLLSLTAQGALPYTPHHGPGPFDSYVAMDVPYAPVKAIWEKLEKSLGHPLKNRGEAHITVITPPEYYDGLRSALSIDEIDQIVTARKIQSARYKVICTGRGEAQINGKQEATYYLVLSSPDLVSIRTSIYRRFVAKGGNPKLFNPQAFFPHITVGFTLRDLHESDGVRKGVHTCLPKP